jgi:hypothetical protein
MWLSAIKLAFQAGSHIYKNRQETKMLMSDAQKRHALAMAKGEARVSRQIIRSKAIGLERRIHFAFIVGAHRYVSLGSLVEDPTAMDKMKLFFEYFSDLPFWYQTIFVGVIASVYGLKATDLIKRK